MKGDGFVEAAMKTGRWPLDDLAGAILGVVNRHARCSTAQIAEAVRGKGLDVDTQAVRSKLKWLEAQGDIERSKDSPVNCTYWEPARYRRTR
jgi:Ribonuclease R winged-helix domain.